MGPKSRVTNVLFFDGRPMSDVSRQPLCFFLSFRENQEKFDIAMKDAEEAKEKALAEQKAALQREKEFAVAHAHSREQVHSARKLAELRRRYLVTFSFFFVIQKSMT